MIGHSIMPEHHRTITRGMGGNLTELSQDKRTHLMREERGAGTQTRETHVRISLSTRCSFDGSVRQGTSSAIQRPAGWIIASASRRKSCSSSLMLQDERGAVADRELALIQLVALSSHWRASALCPS
jgi:hypothetical protein